MSESVKAWFKAYLICVAETYGAALTSVPLEEKGKKVQLVEFLTVGSENEDSIVWALISDKSLFIPVKFSKEAVIECNKKYGRRLTECKTAFLVTIKQFKPICTRVPSRRGMSVETQLALQCESVSVIGSMGESRWGNPKELDSDTDLQEWSHGLKQDGGAGNVLKERKKDRETNTGGAPLPAKRPVSPPKAPVAEAKPRISTSLEPMAAYHKLWHDSFQNPIKFVRPASSPRQLSAEPRACDSGSSKVSRRVPLPMQTSAEPHDARDLGFSSPSQKYSPSSSPISGWSPSPSPIKGKRASNSPSPKPSSYLTAPTPAQRRFKSPAVSVVTQDKIAPTPATSSPTHNGRASTSPSPKPSSSLFAPTPAQRRLGFSAVSQCNVAPMAAMSSPMEGGRASKSPSPQPSSYLSAPMPAERQFESTAPAVSVVTQRKVARPPSPPPVGSGPARILVPDSDTSQSQSQPCQLEASQHSEPSQALAPLQDSQPVKEEEVLDLLDQDMDVLDEDDAQTDQRLFRRRGDSIERAEPAKKRRMLDREEDVFSGFSLGLDCVEWGPPLPPVRVVGWERVWSLLKSLS